MLTLVLEADPDYAGILAETARFGGHQVAVVASEDGARRLFERERPSLVLMGVTEGGGLTLLEEFRHQLPTVPIVIVSASDALSHVIRCLEAGADDYITKPFHPSELRARLRAVCRRGIMAEPPEPAPRPPTLSASLLPAMGTIEIATKTRPSTRSA